MKPEPTADKLYHTIKSMELLWLPKRNISHSTWAPKADAGHSESSTERNSHSKKFTAGQRKTSSSSTASIGDFGLLASDGTLLGNPVHYRDARTDGILEKAFAVMPREEIFSRTGLQFMQINTLYQLYSMVLEKSPLLQVADKMLMMPSLLNYLFTGRMVDEATAVSTSQLIDPRTGGFVRELFDTFGIPFKITPEIIKPGQVIGGIRQDISAELGIKPVPVAAVGSHDTASAVAAVPAESGNWCYISSGTWSLMGLEIPEPFIDEKTVRYGFTNEGGVGGTIRYLKNIMGLWLVQECKRQWAKEGEDISYARLTEMAAEAEPRRSFVNCNSSIFLAPGGMVERIANFCRDTAQPVPESKGQVVRCALESLALTYRDTLNALEDVLGKRIDVIHIVGGGTQNTLLSQMTADACNRQVVAGPVEATAIGNILMQAVALGDLASTAELREVVRNSYAPVHYDPRDTAKWDDAWERFEKIRAGR